MKPTNYFDTQKLVLIPALIMPSDMCNATLQINKRVKKVSIDDTSLQAGSKQVQAEVVSIKPY